MRVVPTRDGVIVEAMRLGARFDPLPDEECIPADYLTGARHVLPTEGGWVVGYEGPFGGETFFVSENGDERTRLFRGRTLGFARAPSGDVLALVAGRAHLGRGAVLRLDREAAHRARVVAVLPVEPSGAVLDDRGTLVGYGGRFLFRVDEHGRVENLHYVAREIGRVASIARSADGSFYLGVGCGVLRLVPRDGGYDELFWSARDGASGRWRSC